ncbi:M1 family metallopeptidase [Leucobacter musarum]|uniref:M1 family metallopeptidase n=1 Tax=Leucobacter musarum TaxID=1930747 RepID=UPI000AFE30F1|nr:M1 family metallopeptidase [Leucobacter musarum]
MQITSLWRAPQRAHLRTRRRTRAIALAASLALTAPLGLALGTSAVQAAEPIDGGQSIGDSLFTGIGNTGYDVSHYDVQLRYVADGSITATTTITAQAPEALRSFSLDFEGLTVDSVLVNGNAATFTRTEDPATSAYKLIITPTAPVAAGEFTVAVSYSGTPVTHTDPDGSPEGWVPTSDGATALGQPVGTMTWIPSNNTPADKATFDFAITIPTQIGGKDAAAASNGELISRTPSGDGSETTWVWQQQKQMATMVTMLSIGNYDVHESSVTLTDGRVIPEWSFVDSSVRQSLKDTIATRRGQIQGMIQFLETKYGPYPGNSTGLVFDVTSLGYALETQDRSYFEGNVSVSTLVHELAHQWFGDEVSPADWNSIWISEGMATYSSAMYAEEVQGSATTTATTYYNSWNTTAATHARWATPPGAMTDPADLFGWQVYNRGAMTFEALKQALTPPVYNELIKTWIADNAGTSQTTTEFRALAEELSGRDLGGFFQDWIFDADKPAWQETLDLALASDPAGGEVPVGSDVSYTLTALNTGKVSAVGSVVSVDLSALPTGVVDAATLPAELSLTGDHLTWTVPETGLGASATVSFVAHIGERAHGAAFEVAARADTLGVTCTSCSVAHSTAALPPITEDDLTEETRGGVELPATANPGQTITVTLPSDAYDGETFSGVLFSDPIELGSGPVVGNTFAVTIPSDAELRSHKLAIRSAVGELIGWGDVEVAAAPSAVDAAADADGGATAGATASATATGTADAGAGADSGVGATGGATGTAAAGSDVGAAGSGVAGSGTAGANAASAPGAKNGLSVTGSSGMLPWVLGAGAIVVLAAGALLVAAGRRRRSTVTGDAAGVDDLLGSASENARP